ncbi:MAG: DUF3097 family protein [Actinomycetota bacterium]|nr:DUF3097 family protein [Actinomycetota bacterium]
MARERARRPLYAPDVLDAEDAARRRRNAPPPVVDAAVGMVLRHWASDFTGVVTDVDKVSVRLRSPGGHTQRFLLDEPGSFVLDGRTVTLRRPRAEPPRDAGPRLTASGSVAVRSEAKVARGSRLLVEGVHDAELVEQVWGDDLREEGIVVEVLDGLDHLPSVVDELAPTSQRRLGVLADHLVEHTKESRIVAGLANPWVLVTGHPYVDIWQAVRPKVVGLDRWPDIPMGQDWKTAMAAHLGFDDTRAAWNHIRSRVRTYADLEATLVGAVEQLIDFVTEPAG